ncbi:hypothetical protein ABIA31_008513 [Catenulispora sp. MAP5-51]|uniref:S8 family serine peptidase n=1 Tax=Catenulispora sp. MAP5-51 TaxID=3156298 RepID=UPI003516F438
MHLARKHRIPVIAVAAFGLAAAAAMTTTALASPGASGPSATQQLAALSSGSQIPVIVVLKNQHPDLAAKTSTAQRKQATANDQNALLNHAKSTGAKDVKTFSIVNGFAAKMTPAEAAHLRSDPAVLAVVPDRQIPAKSLTPQQNADLKAAAAAVAPADQSPPDHMLPGVCTSDPSKPKLEPEALQTTQTAFEDPTKAQAQNLATGKGVKVAWIADGVDIHNPDFIRADGTPVFTDYQDFSGTDPNQTQNGAEAFGDASAIAAQGRQVYDLSQYVVAQHALPAGCTITIRGIAPGASLVGLNVFGAAGLVFSSTVVEAIDYAVNVDNVDVINESLGNNGYPTEGIDPISAADDAAVAAGVTVVASTGDAGVTNTIDQPASDPNVISVGATTTLRTQAATGVAGIRNFATSWADGNTAAFSSAGIDVHARVHDLVAPGQDNWALCTPDVARFKDCVNERLEPAPIEDFSGTSQAAPLVAGGAALVIEAYENTHNGARPTPALVKQILTSSATDLGLPATQQGAGQMNTFRAVRMAMSVKDANGSPRPQGDGLLAVAGSGDTQLSLIGNNGSNQSGTVTLTNTSPNAQTVTAHARELTTVVADIKGTRNVAFNDPSLPFFYEGYGAPYKRAYVSQTFVLPAGADHLQGQLAWPGTGSPSIIRLVLVGPNGEYEQFSDPQGIPHYAQVDIQHPAGGTWTAYFFATGNASAYVGVVNYEFLATAFKAVGSVMPSHVSLAPGATQKFTVKLALPSDPGDLSAAVEFDTALHGQSTVPVTLRSLISQNNDGGAFSGTLTGGNARGNYSPAQTEAFFFDVPKGKKNLAVDLTLAGAKPGHTLQVALESPDHQVVSLSTNNVPNAAGDGLNLIPSLDGWADAPAAGRWVLFINDANPVTGDALEQRFTGHVRYDSVSVSASGLPKGKVATGTPITAKVTVKNTGVAPEKFFAEPRLTTFADYPLAVLPGSNATVPLPFPVTGVQATFQVPSHTTALDIAQSSTVPADLTASAFSSVPEVSGFSRGLTASAAVTSPWVTQGDWTVVPTVVGPTNASVTGSATDAMSVHSLAFDKAAVADTGDLWLAGIDASAPGLRPLVLQPGQSGTITIVITPSGPKGTTVNGVIYVDDFAPFFGSGDELAGIPYSYTVK